MRRRVDPRSRHTAIQHAHPRQLICVDPAALSNPTLRKSDTIADFLRSRNDEITAGQFQSCGTPARTVGARDLASTTPEGPSAARPKTVAIAGETVHE